MGYGWLLYYDFLSWTWQLNLDNKRSLLTAVAPFYSVRIQSSIVVLGWVRSTDIPWAVFPSYWRQPGCQLDDQLAVGKGLEEVWLVQRFSSPSVSTCLRLRDHSATTSGSATGTWDMAIGHPGYLFPLPNFPTTCPQRVIYPPFARSRGSGAGSVAFFLFLALSLRFPVTCVLASSNILSPS
jgi:hypothetical protein